MFIGIKKQLRNWDEETPIQSLRFMPSEYVGLGTYARPTKFHRYDKGKSSKVGMSGSWEENLLQQRKKILDAMQHYEDIGRPVTDKHREKLLSGHLPLPGFEEGYELEGSWVSPADLRTILNPDVTFSQQRPTTLVGITQSPNYYRTNREADKDPFPSSGDRVDEILEDSGDGGGAHEGFQYGGFDPNTMFRMPTPQGASHPMSIAMGLNRGDDKTWDWLERLQENPNIPVGRNIDDAAWNQWQQTPRLGLDQLIEQGLVYPRTIKGEPMENAFRLLKISYVPEDWDDMSMEDRYIDTAFDTGIPGGLIPYDEMHDKQKKIIDTLINAPSTYWNDPASGEFETETYASMFSKNNHHLYPDEAYDEYLRYIQHYLDSSALVNDLPHEEQLKLMNPYINHPKHPGTIALDKMGEEYENWVDDDPTTNPHNDFYNRYNNPQPTLEDDTWQDSLERSEPMKIAFQLLKKRKMSPEAKKHKLEYDTKYQSSPERVKYRVELNRERRRRGIYGSGNGKDVSHTKGGKLTLENEHDNRARHFKGRGTLRDDKS